MKTSHIVLLSTGGLIVVSGITVLALKSLPNTESKSTSIGHQIKKGLEQVEKELGIPFNSLLAVMFTESGLNPKARNPNDLSKPVVAAGLIQITKGANLIKDIEPVLNMSVSEQFEKVILPYYRRIPGARGASPGKLRMLNFLPDKANQPRDFVLARREVNEDGELIGDWLYVSNYGFDKGSKGSSGGKGFFTVGDVYDNTENALFGAQKKLETLV